MFDFIRKMDHRQKVILAACFFGFFCNGNIALMMGSALPDMKTAYHLSDTVSGVLLSAHSAGNIVAGFVGALIPMYLGERKSIMLLSGMAFLGYLMMMLWGNPIWLFLGFVMTGIGRGSVTNFNNRTANRLTGGNPSVSNLLHAVFALGAIAAPMAFLVFGGAFGWKAALAYVVLCGVMDLIGFGRMRLEKEYPDRQDQKNRSLVFLKNPSYLILAAMMFCYLCSEYALNGWLVSYIQNKREILSAFGAMGPVLEEAVKAYSQKMATLMWVVMMAGRLMCAFISARFPQKKLMFIFSIGVVAFFGMMLLSASLPMLTLSVAGLGLCMAGICPMIYSDSAVFSNAYPMATSCLLAIGSCGSILMPTLVGTLADRFGFEAGMSAILVTTLLLTVFALLNMILKTRLPREAKPEEQ